MEDSFNGKASDYGKMLGLLPSLLPPSPSSIIVYNRKEENPSVEMWDIPKIEKYLISCFPFSYYIPSWLERYFNITFCPQIMCTHSYITELMFSGFQIEKDTKFREQYGDVSIHMIHFSSFFYSSIYACSNSIKVVEMKT